LRKSFTICSGFLRFIRVSLLFKALDSHFTWSHFPEQVNEKVFCASLYLS
jgi:hypothetical protein